MRTTMSSYWVNRIKQKIEETEVLGNKYKGIPVIPSKKEYYNNFMYKLEIKGNSISYDIDLHNEIDKWMLDNWYYGTRSQWTAKNRIIFFSKKDKLDKERVSTWRPEIYTVERIETSHQQKLYHVNPLPPQWRGPLVRSEILLIPD